VKALNHIIRQWRRAGWQRQGEQLLVNTYWPADYRIDSVVWHHGQPYQITRYDHEPNAQQFSVWAKPAVGPVLQIQPDPRIRRLIRTPGAR
jgi:hypothetical protein